MVKRYWVELDAFDHLKEVEALDGEYVKFEDYERLLEERDALIPAAAQAVPLQKGEQ